jgi:uncharacterized membrane protein
MFKFDPTLLIMAFGVIFISLGIAARLGLWKKWYWQSHGSAYGYIPIGCLFIFYSYYDTLKIILGANSWLFPVLFGLLAALGIWWSVRPPSFIKPKWVRWIEKHPSNLVEAMKRAANQSTDWECYITNEEAVDAWARTIKIPRKR